jgi:peptidoglycan pentaglycine glycine transferase (the first glycine)
VVNRGYEQVEKRKLFFLTLNYYWLDVHSYIQSKNLISILKTYQEIPEHEYDLKIEHKTFLIDLHKTKEEIFSAFGSARYRIHKSIKCGVVIQRAETVGEKRRFYEFYREFVEVPSRKDKILVLQESELDKIEVFFAMSAEGEYLGGIGLLPSIDRCYLYYKYGATTHKYCEGDLLMWHAILYAKENNYVNFDMSYVYPEADKNSDQYGLYRFKKKFGGTLVSFYTYIKVRAPFNVLVTFFKMILQYFFENNMNDFALWLKKLKVFR